jgi:hypothetical protein
MQRLEGRADSGNKMEKGRYLISDKSPQKGKGRKGRALGECHRKRREYSPPLLRLLCSSIKKIELILMGIMYKMMEKVFPLY